jgi:hypothetical protein
MRFIGKLEYLTPKILKKRPEKISYHRVTIVNEDGALESLALTPMEYMKARKRCRKGVLHTKPSFLMKLYAALVVLFG